MWGGGGATRRSPRPSACRGARCVSQGGGEGRRALPARGGRGSGSHVREGVETGKRKCKASSAVLSVSHLARRIRLSLPHTPLPTLVRACVCHTHTHIAHASPLVAAPGRASHPPTCRRRPAATAAAARHAGGRGGRRRRKATAAHATTGSGTMDPATGTAVVAAAASPTAAAAATLRRPHPRRLHHPTPNLASRVPCQPTPTSAPASPCCTRPRPTRRARRPGGACTRSRGRHRWGTR